jgi:hypothetical protein
MDQPQPTTTKKVSKKSGALKDTSTPRIVAHLVYRHRVGLLITNNIALIGYLIMQAVK